MLIQMSFYTRFFELAVKNYEPYFFANYLIQLATNFHNLYEKEKFINENNKLLSSYKLAIITSIQNLFKNGLFDVFGIDVIEKM